MTNAPNGVIELIKASEEAERIAAENSKQAEELRIQIAKEAWSAVIEEIKELLPEVLREYVLMTKVIAHPNDGRDDVFLVIPGLAPIQVKLGMWGNTQKLLIRRLARVHPGYADIIHEDMSYGINLYTEMKYADKLNDVLRDAYNFHKDQLRKQ